MSLNKWGGLNRWDDVSGSATLSFEDSLIQTTIDNINLGATALSFEDSSVQTTIDNMNLGSSVLLFEDSVVQSTIDNINLGSTTPDQYTDYPIAYVNGVALHIKSIMDSSGESSIITLPDAPDGLDKADGTGRFTDIASAIVAGGNYLTSSVIARKDFAFLECWHEKISDKDVVYPLGSTQYGVGIWSGISLSNTVEPQGYSAFGVWDTETRGYGVTWSTLSKASKTKFVQDHENNIYSDNGELTQVRYRIRVIKALDDTWSMLGISPINQGSFFVAEQGSSTTPADFSLSNSWYADNEDAGILIGSSSYLVPIGLIQR